MSHVTLCSPQKSSICGKHERGVQAHAGLPSISVPHRAGIELHVRLPHYAYMLNL